MKTREMRRIEEKDMYPHIANFMESLVYYYHDALRDKTTIRTTTQLRVKLGNNFPEHDVLTAFTTDGGINRIYSVEAKFGVDVVGVFEQAQKRCSYCDYCYIAVPLDRDLYIYFNGLIERLSDLNFYERQNYKIGFMIVDLSSGNVGILRRAKLNSKLNKEHKDKLFRTIYRKTHSPNVIKKNELIPTKQTKLEDKK
ncbi:unnamed protein product [marine sediment metagenome]|uniref:Uncharacterized protein n=1 Tax=marine sediment metagenome TaxID=412755 RepID=X0UEJ2_9ZZZZ